MTREAFDEAFERIKSLAANFKSNLARYRSTAYQEVEARKDFIDKFFIALGWDVNHDVQTNPYEQEVKVERFSGTSQLRADYAFYLAPNFRDVRFYVEAKKPYGELATSDNYFQAIRYGYGNSNPLVVLTDFENFHVLDCRYKPDIDTAIHRAIAKYEYSQYSDRNEFAKIYWLFSREAVANGSIAKYSKDLPRPRGRTIPRGTFPGTYKPVDETLLDDLDDYRETLAQTFKSHNPRLDSETLTEITQRTLDRLVFLRFLEDKLIETPAVVDKFGARGNPWGDFIAASHRLDGIYNGAVFKKHATLDSPTFRVDGDAFAQICKKLSHANSAYNFDAIPIHILGSIYERFLGKVIVATEKRARVVEKLEVRKAGGVYYTPEYIVRYIVDSTVGKLIAGKTPQEIAELRFADIACGSGSFLLGIYELLLQHHGKYYNENPTKVRKGDCIKRDGQLYLSLRKKREILLTNIYGVDIDSQAVEVCQLSLYLRLLKDETTASAHQYLLEFEHAAQLKKLLPDLNKNIVCGNSLIGGDILDGQLFPSEEERKLNPMNFGDIFPGVMEKGGFDAIVGNPPYISMLLLDKNQAVTTKSYWRHKFESASGAFDIYVLFIEMAARLLRNAGFLSYIVPNKFLAAEYAIEFRRWLIENCQFVSLLDFSRVKVWPVSVYPVVPVFRKGPFDPNAIVSISAATKAGLDDLQTLAPVPCGRLKQIPDNLWSFMTQEGAEILLRVLQSSTPLENVADVWGASTVAEGSEYPRLLVDRGHIKLRPDTARFVVSGAIHRYVTTWESEKLSFTHKKYMRPIIRLQPPMPRRRMEQALQPKIIISKVALEPRAFPDMNGEFVGAYTTYVFSDKMSLYSLAAIINSRMMRFLYRLLYDALAMSGGYLRFQPPQIRRLPIHIFDLSLPSEKGRHNEIVCKVEAMLRSTKELANSQTEKDKTYYKNKCIGLDHQIDRLVYELYELSPRDIRLIEDATQGEQPLHKAADTG